MELSQLALQYGTKKTNANELIKSLRELLKVLDNIPSKSLDSKLAEYVFFPISHIFRQSQAVPSLAVELALKCLQVLLNTGWYGVLSMDLGKQLLIFSTFVAGGNPANPLNEGVPEETKQAALGTLASLFLAWNVSEEAKQSFTDAENLPALGHCLTVMLDSITDGPSNDIQLTALSALNNFHRCVTDREALAGFFPGTVSSLIKALQTNSGARRAYMVLQGCLSILRKVIETVLADQTIRGLLDDSRESSEKPQINTTIMIPSWLRATTAQVKLALASITKLRYYTRKEVRLSLLALAQSLVENCRESLQDSISMMVETMIVLSDDSIGEESEAMLRDLCEKDPGIADIIKNIVHDWIVSLPRLMQSNDDEAKSRMIRQLSNSYHLLSSLGVESSIVDDSLVRSLRDSVSAAVTKHGKGGQDIQDQSSGLDIQLLRINGESSSEFPPIVQGSKAQQQSLEGMQVFLQQISRSEASMAIARDMISYSEHASGDSLLASLWLSLNILKEKEIERNGLETFTEVYMSSDTSLDLTEELYSFSLSILTQEPNDQESDWRAQGLALEAVALRAQIIKTDFRIELVEALYPVVQLLGARTPSLQSHAMVALDRIALFCDYKSASDMIINNVDYLVNAVALKLNTFDISPQAPQVLLMMIKLSGPALIPYLDDLVSSIFAALENFHGYPKLVELLFSVLNGIVDEASHSEKLAITSGAELDHRKRPFTYTPMSEVATLLGQRNARAEKARLEEEDTISKEHPQRPWKDSENSPFDSQEDEATLQDGSMDDTSQAVSSEETPKTSKVYTMVQEIARLTQHYLTSSSPQLRRQLLALTSTVCTALHRDENAFLPLINDIWPVVVARLYDDEAYVSVAAARAVSQICIAAGDFMSSRIETEWPKIKDLYWKNHRQLMSERRGKSGRGPYTPAAQVWDALVGLLVAILWHTRVEEEVFDDMLEMAGEHLLERGELREALEARNPDAVWLAMARSGQIREMPPRPQLDGFEFKPIELG